MKSIFVSKFHSLDECPRCGAVAHEGELELEDGTIVDVIECPICGFRQEGNIVINEGHKPTVQYESFQDYADRVCNKEPMVYEKTHIYSPSEVKHW